MYYRWPNRGSMRYEDLRKKIYETNNHDLDANISLDCPLLAATLSFLFVSSNLPVPIVNNDNSDGSGDGGGRVGGGGGGGGRT